MPACLARQAKACVMSDKCTSRVWTDSCVQVLQDHADQLSKQLLEQEQEAASRYCPCLPLSVLLAVSFQVSIVPQQLGNAGKRDMYV